MEYFRTHAQRFSEVLGANRLNHELLNINVVISVLAAVDDVHHWYRHGILASSTVQFSNVLVQWDALGSSGSLGSSQRDSQNSVGTELGLVFSAVQVDHQGVQATLVSSVETDQGFTDRTIDVGNGLQNAFAHVTGLVAVTKFQSFAGASGGTGWGAGTADMTAFQDHISFNSWVTT